MAARARQDRIAAGEPCDATGAPERTCAVTRAKLEPDELIRFVCGPDGTIVPDLAGRLPGRGVWVTNDRATVETAARTNAFARSLKRAVTVPPDLADRVEALQLARTAQALALANKAGLLISGFTKVELAITRGEAIAVVHASDAAEDGCRKLDGKLRTVLAAMSEDGDPAPEPRIVRELTSAELSLAIGRPNVIHAALRKGGAAENFLREAGRSSRYRSSRRGETGQTRAAGPSSSALDTDQV